MIKRALILEDDLDFADNTVLILKSKDYEVDKIAYKNPNTVLKSLREQLTNNSDVKYNIALVDGLRGNWKKIIDLLKSRVEKGVALSTKNLFNQTNERGWIFYKKPVSIYKILRHIEKESRKI